jgi:beta-glucosidase
MDPVFLGRYPADGVKGNAAHMPEIQSNDLKIISSPLDFCGANIYHGVYIRAGRDGKPQEVANPPGFPLTSLYWAVVPDALYWGSKFLHERYKLPVYITENGCSNADWVSLDGKCHDPQRIDFTARYLRELRRAIDDGVDVRGYFHWSIMDNFEWAEGFKHRCGMIHVDYTTQKRTLKDSAFWYRDVIASNGANL